MGDPEASQPEVNQKHKGEPIGARPGTTWARKGLLVGVGQKLGLSIGVDSCPLVGREPILLNMLIGSPGEALLIPDHLQVYLEMLEGIDLIPVVVGDRAEFASSLLGFDEFMAPEDVADGVLTGSPWERRRA